jgi:lipopolysaccharide/colanic/teichoic acid biosynthesis glycosyltransferase
MIEALTEARDQTIGKDGTTREVRLPEALGGAEALRLCAPEVALALGTIVVFALAGFARDAALAVIVALLASYGLGRYRVSYAVVPRDERYSVASAALIAAVLLAFLRVPFEVSAVATYAALAAWAIAASASAIHACGERRADAEVDAEVSRLAPRQRIAATNVVSRETIALLDFVFGSIATIVTAPLLAACAIAIYRDDGAPVIFAQPRIGTDGKTFVMYKFRTMKRDAGPAWVTPGDPRITKVGGYLRRTSLDELPQLFNVLRGEMSLVGPRPEMVEYADRFARTLPAYEDRHAIRPGITGWAQTHYSRNFQPDSSSEVLRYDLFYVANYSVPLYLFCLVKTVAEIAGHRAV